MRLPEMVRARPGLVLRLLVRLIALGALVALFYALNWMSLRVALRNGLHWCFAHLEYTTTPDLWQGAPSLGIEGSTFEFTAECTYIDMFLLLAPFVWRWRASAVSNACRMIGLAGIVGAVNFARVFGAIHFHVNGISWYWTHDVPDALMYWPSFCLAVLLCLWRDVRAVGMMRGGIGAGLGRLRPKGANPVEA